MSLVAVVATASALASPSASDEWVRLTDAPLARTEVAVARVGR